ncbi:unnamed protein product [Clonostachys chloroleuca]|uniref:Reverse transcriptase n=1 Tax=Clonostachys chloroleuca TaxID=1926264 RepID=A0AA35PVT3_9HYPO|nr:unnamed protein product [Clonostachys chloroleuca]
MDHFEPTDTPLLIHLLLAYLSDCQQSVANTVTSAQWQALSQYADDHPIAEFSTKFGPLRESKAAPRTFYPSSWVKDKQEPVRWLQPVLSNLRYTNYLRSTANITRTPPRDTTQSRPSHPPSSPDELQADDTAYEFEGLVSARTRLAVARKAKAAVALWDKARQPTALQEGAKPNQVSARETLPDSEQLSDKSRPSPTGGLTGDAPTPAPPTLPAPKPSGAIISATELPELPSSGSLDLQSSDLLDLPSSEPINLSSTPPVARGPADSRIPCSTSRFIDQSLADPIPCRLTKMAADRQRPTVIPGQFDSFMDEQGGPSNATALNGRIRHDDDDEEQAIRDLRAILRESGTTAQAVVDALRGKRPSGPDDGRPHRSEELPHRSQEPPRRSRDESRSRSRTRNSKSHSSSHRSNHSHRYDKRRSDRRKSKKRSHRRTKRRDPSTDPYDSDSSSSDESPHSRGRHGRKHGHGHKSGRRKRSPSTSSSSEATTATSPRIDGIKFKAETIGGFWPDGGPEPIRYQGSFPYYTDVNTFLEALDDGVDMGFAREIRKGMRLLLRGDALDWYRTQLSVEQRDKCSNAPSIDKWKKALHKRFRMDMTEAQRKVDDLKFDRLACQKGESPRSFAMSVIRYAKMLDATSVEAQLAYVYNRVDPHLRQGLPKPRRHTELHKWLDELDEKATAWRDELQFSRQPAFGKQLNQAKLPLRPIRFQFKQREQVRDFADARPRTPRWKRFLDDRKADNELKTPTDLRRPDIMSSPAWKPPQKQAADGKYRFQRYEKREQREKAFLAGDENTQVDDVLVPDDDETGKRLIDEDSDYVLQETVELSTEDLDILQGEESAFIAEGGETFYCAPRHECRLCHNVFDSANALQRHLKEPGDCSPDIPLDDNRRCRHCQTAFKTRGALFDHLDSKRRCPMTDDMDAEERVMMIHAMPTLTEKTSVEKPGYSYTTFEAYPKPTLQVPATTVLGDSGSSTIIADEDWLRQWPDVEYSEVKPLPVKGLNGSVELSRRATFFIHLRGESPRDRKRHWAIMRVTAWVMKNLGPSLLLGTRWLHPHGVTIDYRALRMEIGSCQNLRVPIQVVKENKLVKAKITTTQSFVLKPGRASYVPIEKPRIPTDRSLMMTPDRMGVVAAMVSHDTAFVVVVNNSTEPLTIPRGTRLGTVSSFSQDDSLDLTTWTQANQLWMAEFNETAYIASAETESNEIHDQLIEQADIAPAGNTEHWNTSESLPEHGPGPPTGDFPKLYQSLGILRISDQEESTPEGVHYNAEDRKAAEAFRKLIIEHDIWRDRGTIPVPREELMKIHLKTNWQDGELAGKPYVVSPKDRQIIDDTFNPLHDTGRMEWVGDSCPFAAPVFVVWKTVDGQQKGRVVIDLRGLNAATLPDAYPLPRQEDLLASVRGARYFTVVDARSFFYQFLVHPDHANKFTIVSHRGLERSNVLLMGYRNSPAYVQRWIDRQLFPHREFARAYVDDIVIFSNTLEEHLQHVKTIFDLFESLGLWLAPGKSFVGYQRVQLLGHAVDGEGVALTDDRVNALAKWSFPSSLKALETYIGATGWIRSFIPLYAQKMEVLHRRKTALLAQGQADGATATRAKRKRFAARTKVEDDSEARGAFELMQQNLVDCLKLKLVHPDDNRQLFVKLDASKRGFGVTLFYHDGNFDPKNPVGSLDKSRIQYLGFWSKLLSQAERNYWPTELEVAALVWVATKNMSIFHGAKNRIIVLTDHSAMAPIVRQKSMKTTDVLKMNHRLQSASIFLSQFDIDVYHIPGKLNVVPDALSRLPRTDDEEQMRLVENDNTLEDISATHGEVALVISEVLAEPSMLQQFIDGYKTDTKYQKIISQLQQKTKKRTPVYVDGFLRRPGLRFALAENGLLYHEARTGQRRLCIPTLLIQPILEMAHGAHHFGIERTRHEMDGFVFPNLWERVKAFIQHCQCATSRQSTQQPPGDLDPILPEFKPYLTQTMDFIVGLPLASAVDDTFKRPGFEEYDTLLTITCKSSKKRALIPGYNKYTAEDWAANVLKFWMLADWGLPKVIISDRDRKWMGDFWQAIFKALQTRLIQTTSWHSPGDGQSESTNQIVEAAIRYGFSVDPDAHWPSMLPAIQSSLNNAFVTALNATPNEVVMGFRPQTPLTILREKLDGRHDEEAHFSILRKARQWEAEIATDFAAARYKRLFDARHRQIEFSENQWVYLRLHRGYVVPGQTRKFGQHRVGPFKILRKVNPRAYELDLPEHWKIHPVVSILQLEEAPQGVDPFDRPRRNEQPRVFVEGDDDIWQSFELETIIAKRKYYNRDQYLVRWKGYDAGFDTWLYEEELDNAPELLREFTAKRLYKRGGVWRPRAVRGN